MATESVRIIEVLQVGSRRGASVKRLSARYCAEFRGRLVTSLSRAIRNGMEVLVEAASTRAGS